MPSLYKPLAYQFLLLYEVKPHNMKNKLKKQPTDPLRQIKKDNSCSTRFTETSGTHLVRAVTLKFHFNF